MTHQWTLSKEIMIRLWFYETYKDDFLKEGNTLSIYLFMSSKGEVIYLNGKTQVYV